MSKVWSVCVPGGDTKVEATGTKCYPILIKSGIGQAELMKIWKMVDTKGANTLNYMQFGHILGTFSSSPPPPPSNLVPLAANHNTASFY
jgi:hypothetical protein